MQTSVTGRLGQPRNNYSQNLELFRNGQTRMSENVVDTGNLGRSNATFLFHDVGKSHDDL